MKKNGLNKSIKDNTLSKNKCRLKVIQENIVNSTIKSLNEHVYNPDIYGLIRNRTK